VRAITFNNARTGFAIRYGRRAEIAAFAVASAGVFLRLLWSLRAKNTA